MSASGANFPSSQGRKDGMTYKKNYGITLFIIFLFLICSTAVFAAFSGKVVAVKDGDTLEVMKEGIADRVRLHGIDCPEKGQAFGRRAKQFASDLAFGETVKVIEMTSDARKGVTFKPSAVQGKVLEE